MTSRLGRMAGLVLLLCAVVAAGVVWGMLLFGVAAGVPIQAARIRILKTIDSRPCVLILRLPKVSSFYANATTKTPGEAVPRAYR
jgi:hypothetical protein